MIGLYEGSFPGHEVLSLETLPGKSWQECQSLCSLEHHPWAGSISSGKQICAPVLRPCIPLGFTGLFLRYVKPLDLEAMVESVKKTSLLVVEPGYPALGVRASFRCFKVN